MHILIIFTIFVLKWLLTLSVSFALLCIDADLFSRNFTKERDTSTNMAHNYMSTIFSIPVVYVALILMHHTLVALELIDNMATPMDLLGTSCLLSIILSIIVYICIRFSNAYMIERQLYLFYLPRALLLIITFAYVLSSVEISGGISFDQFKSEVKLIGNNISEKANKIKQKTKSI